MSNPAETGTVTWRVRSLARRSALFTIREALCRLVSPSSASAIALAEAVRFSIFDEAAVLSKPVLSKRVPNVGLASLYHLGLDP